MRSKLCRGDRWAAWCVALWMIGATPTSGLRRARADGPPLQVRAQPTGPAEDRLEASVVPVVSADTDRGIGFGALAALARFAPGYRPYRWRLELLGFATVKPSDSGVGLPFHSDYLKLDLPGLLDNHLRLTFELAFNRQNTAGYYGLGNVSPDLPAGTSHQYGRTYPRARAQARLAMLPPLYLVLGGSYTYNWIELYPGSKLVQDLARGDPLVRSELRGTDDHGVLELFLGWTWDTRDHEFAPTRGMFHEVSWRFSPGPAVGTELPYAGINVTTRFYRALHGEKLVLAGRLMWDLLLGDPPFYELTRHGGVSPSCAVGGDAAVRGVPLHRYQGKVKLLANLELRSKLFAFSVLRQRFNLGATAFIDTGRVWTDYHSRPELDGEGLGLKLGLGSGARLQWGETFVLRVDTAWSPDADPIGVYFNVNHIF